MTTLDTLTNEPEPPRPRGDYVRTGIHLAVFAATAVGTAYGATYLTEMSSQNRWMEHVLPIFLLGSIAGLAGLQYVTSKVLDRVRPYQSK